LETADAGLVQGAEGIGADRANDAVRLPDEPRIQVVPQPDPDIGDGELVALDDRTCGIAG
jgi:hypothetical protein